MVQSSLLPPRLPLPPSKQCSPIQAPRVKITSRSGSHPGRVIVVDPKASRTATNNDQSQPPCGSCPCGRRRLFVEAAATAFLPIRAANASDSLSDYAVRTVRSLSFLVNIHCKKKFYLSEPLPFYIPPATAVQRKLTTYWFWVFLFMCIQSVLNRFHPPKPEWYEEFYASVLDTCTKPYEAEVSEQCPFCQK